MKIGLDENPLHSLVQLLSQLGYDVDTVPLEEFAGKDDDGVVRRTVGWALPHHTDLDFSDERKYTPGTHEGVLLVRLPQPARSALTERILALFRSEDMETWPGCVVSATPTKVRIRRPQLAAARKYRSESGAGAPYTLRIWRRVRITCVYPGF